MNKTIICFGTVLLLTGQALAGDDLRSMQVSDLQAISDVSSPSISPDGTEVVYTLSNHNVDKDLINSDLWLVNYEGGTPRQLTNTDEVSEWAAQFSPDGKSIAYLKTVTNEQDQETTQIFLFNLQTEEEAQLSNYEEGVLSFSWSPDSNRLVFTALYGGEKPNQAGTAAPIVIDRFQFMEDGRGYLAGARSHLFVFDIQENKTLRITRGDQDYLLPSWSPDGRWIAYVSKEGNRADRHLNTDVFIVRPEPGAQAKKISQFKGTDVDPYWESPPVWSPDSKQLAWLQADVSKWVYYAPWQLTVADIATGKAKNIARIDRCFYVPKWSADGKSIFALVELNRSTLVASINVQTQEISYLNSGARFALDFDVADNDRIVVLDSTDNSPFELHAIGEKQRLLTNHNQWLDTVALGVTKPFSFSNNGVEIDGIMLLPADYQAGDKLPTIFRLHGGPVYQFSHEFMSDWQIYAAKGYAVVGINPRGSSGKGFDFSRAIYADWGNLDVSDILAGADHLVAQGIVDENRMGLGGWSYGGILTDYVIASDTRFKAAVSGAGAGNVLANYGHDQYSREYELELGTPWENYETYKRLSYPLLKANKITTPTLFQCAEKDFNVPCLGAEQLYQALKSTGIDTQLVIYPDQYHGITVPSYLLDRMARSLDWYDTYLVAKQAN